MRILYSKRAVAILGALALSACSGKQAHIAAPSAPPTKATAADTDAAFDLLMQGNEHAAHKKLKVILKREPMNPTAQLLNDSIERDPKVLLGPQSYPYTVSTGETIAGLAQHFLGNRMKAYQLLRYNDLKAPAVLTSGQILRIPGEPVRIDPVRRPEAPPSRPTSAPPAATAKSKPATKPALPVANPAAARQARAAGLAALNQGNIDRAVGLLRRAAILDPANSAIAHDLSRAERIAATVKARK